MGLLPDQNGVSDEMLIQAARKRILDSLSKGGGDVERIVNNVYGGGGSGGGGGISEGMDPMSQDPTDSDYFVDILRQNLKPGEEADFTDPDSGQRTKRALPSGGWSKNVHRFTKKKVNP